MTKPRRKAAAQDPRWETRLLLTVCAVLVAFGRRLGLHIRCALVERAVDDAAEVILDDGA